MKFFDSPAMRQTLKRYLRAQMGMKNIDYRSLSQRLAQLGVAQTEGTLRNKINKGNLGAQLFMYLLLAMEIKALDLQQLKDLLAEIEHEME